MINVRQEICAVACHACGHKEMSNRTIIQLGQVIDGMARHTVYLCVPCKNQLYFPLKYGWQKGMSCRVIALSYDRSEQFKIVAFYEEMKAVRVKNEEGEEHTVLISQLEAW